MDQPSVAYSALDDFEARYVRPKIGRTLIVGSHIYNDKPDRRKRHADAVGWDMIEGDGVDRVVNLEKRLPVDAGKFAHIECMSVLEHSKRPWLLAENIERLLESGGTLYITVPFVWKVHGYPDDYWRFTVNGIRLLFQRIKWDEVLYGNQGLTDRVRRVEVDGFWYLPRSETFGFGRLCES